MFQAECTSQAKGLKCTDGPLPTLLQSAMENTPPASGIGSCAAALQSAVASDSNAGHCSSNGHQTGRNSHILARRFIPSPPGGPVYLHPPFVPLFLWRNTIFTAPPAAMSSLNCWWRSHKGQRCYTLDVIVPVGEDPSAALIRPASVALIQHLGSLLIFVDY